MTLSVVGLLVDLIRGFAIAILNLLHLSLNTILYIANDEWIPECYSVSCILHFGVVSQCVGDG